MKKKIADKKILLSGTLAVVAALCLLSGVSFADNPGSPCVNHTLSGYAWSETVGSISFSCENSPSATSDYGVDINPTTGKFSGHAWNAANGSEPGVGYISFDRAETGNPPSNDVCSATLDCIAKLDGEKVKGWARAISGCDWDGTKCTGSGAGSKAGNWDGWIRLDCSEDCGANVYDLTVSSTQTAGQYPLQGFAWSGGSPSDPAGTGVIGTIKFNGSGYGVLSEVGPIAVDNKPAAAFSCDNAACHLAGPAGPCTCYSDAPLTLLNESTETVSDPIKDSRWFIDGNEYSDCTSYVKKDCDIVGNKISSIPPLPPLAGPHDVKLTVKDTINNDESSITHQIIFIKGTKAAFSCSSDGIWFDDCANLDPKPAQGSIVWLKNESTPPTSGNIVSNSWSYTGNAAAIFNVVNGDTVTTTLDILPATIKLQVWDDLGGYSEISQMLSVIPLPIWKERTPFKNN